MKSNELAKFVTDNIEPLKDSIYGNRYRAAAHLTDGTYLPCVVFQSRQAQVQLALRRFKELRWKRSQYRGVVETFVSGGSHVAEYNLKAVEISPFAWPLGLLKTIHGETTMGWTAFVAEMNDGTMHSYGTQFHYEFFELPQAYSLRPTGKCAGDSRTEADAEDGGLGLLRREGGAGVAHQVGRHGGDSDAHHQQPEAAGRCGPAAGAGRAIAARHHRPGEGQRPRRAHSYGADLH